MIKASIYGASGYAGGEILRILLSHPKVTIKQATSRQFAGQMVSQVHPNLRKKTDLVFSNPIELKKCDILFVALPNGESMKYMNKLKILSKKIVDLGADYRLRKKEIFENWYKQKHQNPEMLKKFIYGIAELHREEIKKSSYIACAGCEATVSILSLYPLVKHNLIEEKIIIDAKMSSSQAGLKPSLSSHHPERSGVVRSYMPSGHRHTAEIIQELSPFAENFDVAISATAIDIVRGLLVTIHTTPKSGVTEKEVWKAYRAEYGNEPFIRIVKEKQGLYRFPEPKILQGTNYCDIGFEMDNVTKRLVVIGAIDNLVKGTAGQAVQAMNIMYDLPETMGLEFPGLHPI
ncbi:N-acetyl-gamma-glutamyl-phosphate reductase [Candidatus Roizmanbacteria bacterium CG02_land_8_20_14_3_00_36_15]|uniref:N-acetyl-gamma-glutamyl-phosphate reductase n=1 Tax=Candidatus Roizmanbacteria bacterium CG_4_9_14_0_2_um_filter_35_15 TaxID=1974836 RepID=A0A2M8F4T1_9BACT|nr:MAG: N-acetyl-gamma-glutamyl-phosphate reductase [Candidatus Roizmanbacteria bacterium CG03_land_8_20_14_0_80_36_21]PIV37363.1 MAG: N-acetyl-gamma-glutamyl-phosphate reductase [Candidatus Roizmanbacteria bacterium CG02_land_8_20_14_3_00_36_15]PJA52865.1 MAG: N-acetyl-gamma-glutamyl-phosphate reductase [Candidatus Roizmanbacteria bacterium CG_4_9_14_3_um_filter_36_11]PJC34297.1 MAG: N-acetyl-gamma-glutamyl-phosphate reductase [Candidatus Roizmanbacteria bacterium CG_4_9_14_0_2_um_filter_35_15]